MDRRAFLRDAGAMALGAACQAHAFPQAFAAATPRANGMWNTANMANIAVFDPTLAQGRALAREAARVGCVALSLAGPVSDPVDRANHLAVNDDIGRLWHAGLARRVPPCAVVVGALRPSDRFVLARLAAAQRVTLIDFAGFGRLCAAKSDSPDCARRT